ncbi:S-adenosyl-L-methionine-dependent methyltransferase [Nemania sp. FL0916]|nr:S-adenosyl-L-methionine-dependent methyltransferase [Nemania sp. FL0916]
MAETPSDSKPYIFGRDSKSSIRLNYQHMLIKTLCDDQLLHTIVHQGIASRSSIRVADVATGTALWLTELSDILPTHSELHGFDISHDQYPPKEWLPKNVVLHTHDAFQPFAPEFLGSFDVVNLRFFITLLSEENIHPLLSNLKSLLKPGGFLHWLDFDPRSAKAIATRPGLHMPHTESVVSLMRKAQQDVDSWLLHDSDLFEVAGLDPVAYKRIQLRDHLRPMWNHCHIMGMEEVSRRMSRNTEGEASQPSPLLQQIEGLEAEFAQSSSIDAQWFIMVGQMPSTQ